MKRLKFNLLILCTLFLQVLHADAPVGQEFTKNITKEFSISSDGTVGVSNKYGSIDIRPGTGNQVKMEVTLKVEAGNQEKANEVFERIQVTFENSPSSVKATTSIEALDRWKSWFNFGSSDQFQINYVVYAPATVVLDLDNKYGNIYVGDTDNRANVVLKYGELKIGNINGTTTIDMAYSDGSIQSTEALQLNMAYSDLYLGHAGNTNLDAKYSDLQGETLGDLNAVTGYADVKFQSVGRLTNSGKFDDFILGDVESLDIDTKYSGYAVSSLKSFADVDMSYGSLRVSNVHRDFQSINIKSEYTDVALDIEDSASFRLEAVTKYCDINHHGLEVYHEVERTGDHEVKGFRGSREASATIIANMSYGGLSIR